MTDQDNKIKQGGSQWWTNNGPWVAVISILTPLLIIVGIALRNSKIAYDHPGINDYKAGHYAKSVEESKAYLKAHPDPGSPDQQYLGYAYLKTGQYENAVQALRVFLKVAPHNSEAHYGLGKALFKQGKMLEARREFQTAIDVEFETSSMKNRDEGVIDRSRAMIEEIDKSQ